MQKRKLLSLVLAGVLTIGGLAGCSSNSQEKNVSKASSELVIYSGRNEKLIKSVIDAFEKESGIKVTVRAGGASELANAIVEETANPKADIFIANDAGTLEMLKMKGLLQAAAAKTVEVVPADLRATDGSWIGVSLRTRVIMYNTNLVKENEAPKSLLDLIDPKWKGQIAMSKSSNESVVGNVTAMRLALGDQVTEDFLRGLLANKVQALKGHTDVRQAVGKGEFKLGWVNHYYYELEKQAGSPVAAIYPDQGAAQMGTTVNISGVGIIKGAQHPDAAQKLVEFLLKPSTQELFAKDNFEIPVLPGVPVNSAKPIDSFKRANVKLETYGTELKNTVNMLEKVGMP